MDAFSLYNSVYLEIIAYEEDASKQEQSTILLGAFNHHHLESQKILINSVYQSFCGNYNIAYSLLRSFLECHMRGVFLNQSSNHLFGQPVPSQLAWLLQHLATGVAGAY